MNTQNVFQPDSRMLDEHIIQHISPDRFVDSNAFIVLFFSVLLVIGLLSGFLYALYV